METDSPRRARATRRVTLVAFISAAVLLVGGFAIALMPALVFHSGLASIYGRYPTEGMFLALASLVPANIGAVSVLRPHLGTALLVVLLLVLTVIAGVILFLAFSYIYLSTIDWFVF
jgi:hypothetical protein